MANTIEGIVNFSNITAHDVYNGQSTGKYTMTITLSEEDAATLAASGVKIKEYNGAKQRKFSTQYEVGNFTAEGDKRMGEVPYNSRVRLQYDLGKPHPVHGVSTYLKAVKVLEEAENSAGSAEF
jgi:hypothetical protein